MKPSMAKGRNKLHDTTPGQGGLKVALWFVVCSGLFLRLWYALTTTLHVDEFATIYASKVILERGLPLLPSGLLYSHGTPFSYLAAPFVALGDRIASHSEIVWRVPSVLIGVATLLLLYKITRTMLNSSAALIAVILLAFAPEAIEWSGRARMYSLLQFLVLLDIFTLYRAMEQRGPRYQYLFPLVFLATLFTHAEAVLLLPAMAIAVVIAGRGPWLLSRQGLMSFSLCALGVPLFLLTQVFSSSALAGTAQGLPAVPGWLSRYVGGFSMAHTLFYRRYFLDRPGIYVTALFSGTVLLLAFDAARRIAIGNGRTSIGLPLAKLPRRELSFLCTIYSVTVLELVFVVRWRPSEHYVFFILPIASVVASWAIWAILRIAAKAMAQVHQPILRGQDIRWLLGRNEMLARHGVLLATLAGSAVVSGLFGTWNVRHQPGQMPDYASAFRYVRQVWRDGDIIMSPSVASSLYLGKLDFFPLQIGYEFAVATSNEGELAHRLTGAPWLGAVDDLHRILTESERVWFVVDEHRFEGRYTSEFRRVVNMGMQLEHLAPAVRVYLAGRHRSSEEADTPSAERAALDFIALRRPDILQFYVQNTWPMGDTRAIVRDWLNMTDEAWVREVRRDPVTVAISLGWRGQGKRKC